MIITLEDIWNRRHAHRAKTGINYSHVHKDHAGEAHDHGNWTVAWLGLENRSLTQLELDEEQIKSNGILYGGLARGLLKTYEYAGAQ